MKTNLNWYKAIIFDWDGTLVDTCGLVLDAHNHVRAFMGHDLWTMDDFMGQASKSAREYYPEVYGSRADEAQKILYEYVDKHHLTYLKPMGGAADLLNQISQQNIPMGVVSNKRHQTLYTEINEMVWMDYFGVVIGAGYATKDKPNAAPLLMAMNKIDKTLKPSDILYVGDTQTDLLCAQNAGCPVVFIQADKQRPDLIEKYQPDFVFDDLSEFMEAARQKTTINKAC